MSANTSTDAQPRFERRSLYESPLPGTPTVPSTRSLRTLTVAPGRPADNEAPVFERLIRKNFPSGMILRKRKKPIDDTLGPTTACREPQPTGRNRGFLMTLCPPRRTCFSRHRRP